MLYSGHRGPQQVPTSQEPPLESIEEGGWSGGALNTSMVEPVWFHGVTTISEPDFAATGLGVWPR